MKAVIVTRPGAPEVLQIRDVPTPEPGPDEVRVRVRAFGINRADLLQRRGQYPPPKGVTANILGLEYAGEIDRVGAGVTGVRQGDRVMGIVAGGAYAEAVTVRADHLLPIPEGLSFEQAAAIPEVFLTAFDALEQLAVVSSEWVLVHAVGSGVGTASVQLIAARGARSIGTSRTPEKLDRATDLGLDVAIDSRSGALADAVKRATSTGANAAIDLLGGQMLADTLSAMTPRGRIILVGLTAGRRAELDLGTILTRRLTITGTVLRSRSDQEKARLVHAARQHLLPLFAAGKASPVVDTVLPLTQIVAAHQRLEASTTFGKVVVTIA